MKNGEIYLHRWQKSYTAAGTDGSDKYLSKKGSLYYLGRIRCKNLLEFQAAWEFCTKYILYDLLHGDFIRDRECQAKEISCQLIDGQTG